MIQDIMKERVTCSEVGRYNTYGIPKLVATIVPDGISVWCNHCRCAHLISKERIVAAWKKGESVQCVGPLNGHIGEWQGK